MENTGLVAVGHLLANKSPDNYFKALRHFCTLIFCNMDEKDIHKSSGFWRFDQYYKSVNVNVDSFGKFVNGILRRNDTDRFQLQLQIERLAWDMVKFDFDRFIGPESASIVNRAAIYRLFCVFNRFCCRNGIPMVLPERACIYLCKELGIPVMADQDEPKTFTAFISHVAENIYVLKAKAIKRLYDEFVRDVIKEGRVKYRVLGSTVAAAGSLMISNDKIRTHTVTSRHLIIFDDNEDPDQPICNEPTGKVLHRIPLIDIETKVVNSMFAKNKKYLHLVSKSKATPSIEMCFDITKDHFDLYSWSQAIQEAVYSTQVNTTRLSKAWIRLGLAQPNGTPLSSPADRSHRHSAPESPPHASSSSSSSNSSSSSDIQTFNLAAVMPVRSKSSASLPKQIRSPKLKLPPPAPPSIGSSSCHSGSATPSSIGGGSSSSASASPLLRRALASTVLKIDDAGAWSDEVKTKIEESRAC